MFYEELGRGRTIDAFEHSLKNARDTFDSHIQGSGRQGWRDTERKPTPLSKISKKIFITYNSKERIDVWREVEQYADKEVKKYKDVIADLISIQESENYEHIHSKTEGGKKVVVSHRYERSLKLRNKAFQIHGYNCMVCGFNFQEKYGAWGKEFGEVHHLEPLSNSHGQKRETNPEKDLAVVCANCHRMIHRKKGITLTINELKAKIS